MSRKAFIAIIFVAVMTMAGPAMAQTPGGSAGAFGITAEDMAQVTRGWRVGKNLMGASIYNHENDKIGVIKDVIIAPDRGTAYAIVAVGGFLGMNRHHVAVPVNQLKVSNGKFTLPGATKKTLKSIPEFKYAE
jgi:hypothetical protein